MAGQKKRKRNSGGSGSSSSRRREPPATVPPPAPSSSASQEASPASNCRHQCPRLEKQRIRSSRVWDDDVRSEFVKSEYINRPFSQDWDDYDTLFYNAWLGVVLKPTRVADMDLMRRMGIENTVLGMLEAIGLGTICTKQYDMFPELVRQFIATVRVGYEKEREKNARDGFLSFFIRGVRYSLPLRELAEIYGFGGELPCVALPDRFDGIQNFWSYIGNGEYDSKTSA
ncbi:unnamed protein product [Arabidopsis halleri]